MKNIIIKYVPLRLNAQIKNIQCTDKFLWMKNIIIKNVPLRLNAQIKNIQCTDKILNLDVNCYCTVIVILPLAILCFRHATDKADRPGIANTIFNVTLNLPGSVRLVC